MTCTVSKPSRPEYVREIVISAIKSVAGPQAIVLLPTSLGPNGLGHTPVLRKMYYEPIRTRLAVKGCEMKTLTPNKFADAKLKTVEHVAVMVEKDLG